MVSYDAVAPGIRHCTLDGAYKEYPYKNSLRTGVLDKTGVAGKVP
jgi:hypothetical protein